MASNQEQYTAARDALLAKITAFLKEDPRFLAAWLAGSFGRGEQTWLSDLDLHVVVKEPPFKHNRQEIAATLAERVAMLRQLCDEMEALMPAVVAFGGYIPFEPREVVEKRLALFEEP